MPATTRIRLDGTYSLFQLSMTPGLEGFDPIELCRLLDLICEEHPDVEEVERFRWRFCSVEIELE